MLEKISEISGNINGFLSNHNPDLYSAIDAAYILSKTKDKKYLLGGDELDPRSSEDQSKIWSLPPEVLDKIKNIIDHSGHVQGAPFVMGIYDMSNQTMEMNDLCISDPILGGMMATGHLEGFSMPFLRGIYYASRRSWWRHESIHARHHHQMAYFLDTTDTNERTSWDWYNGWQGRLNLEEAGITIHEAGIEELLTRWQSLKESRGLREKAVSALALLYYLEYAPHTGIRNLLIDTKETTTDLIEDGRIRIPIKIAAAASAFAIPHFLNEQTHMIDGLGQAISSLIPVSEGQTTGAIWRVNGYAAVATIAALLSRKEKGAFQKQEDEDRRMPTAEYKFPYVYNPITSLTRSVGFLRYLHNVWDQIPNYRSIESPASIDVIKGEIDQRVAANLNNRQHSFTMRVVEDALRPFEGHGSSTFPQDAYIKGMFTPAMYLRLRELYS